MRLHITESYDTVEEDDNGAGWEIWLMFEPLVGWRIVRLNCEDLFLLDDNNGSEFQKSV